MKKIFILLFTLLWSCGDKPQSEDEKMAIDIFNEIKNYKTWEQLNGFSNIINSADGTHGDYVQLWINNSAIAVMKDSSSGQLPNGAIIVKEGYEDSNGTDLNYVAIMKKVDGFSSKNGDWFWATYIDGKVQRSGADDLCIGCHASGQDYVRFTNW